MNGRGLCVAVWFVLVSVEWFIRRFSLNFLGATHVAIPGTHGFIILISVMYFYYVLLFMVV